MLGVGMQEMLIIGIAALLIFGPGKLPEVMGQAGKLYRDFRNMTSELTGEFEKTVAEAKEMGNSLTGDLGGMQKQVNSVTASVKRDLGAGSKSKVTNTSNLKKSTSSTSSTSKKSGSSSSGGSKSMTTSSRSTASSSSKSSRSTSSTSLTPAKKPATPVASKEDPAADVSLFEPVAPERVRRARKATPSIITDPTPRGALADLSTEEPETMAQAVVADDPLARARQRRRNAGYAQRSA